MDQHGNVFEGSLPEDEKEKQRVVAAVDANDGEAIKAALGV